jgi:hypothetical protein
MDDLKMKLVIILAMVTCSCNDISCEKQSESCPCKKNSLSGEEPPEVQE